jgi:hypothetical protein
VILFVFLVERFVFLALGFAFLAAPFAFLVTRRETGGQVRSRRAIVARQVNPSPP